MAEPIILVPRLDLTAVQALVASITSRPPDTDIVLDASNVTHLGALCTQAILAAANRSNAAGGSFAVSNVSERVEEQLACMGLSSEKLMEGTA